MNKNVEHNNGVTIKEILRMILNRWQLVLIVTLLVTVCAFTYTSIFVDAKYESKGTLYVSSESARANEALSYNTVITNQKLVNTYMEILKSNTFFMTVSEDIGNKYTSGEINKMVSLSSLNETELLSIRVVATDPSDAYMIANSIIRNASEEIERVVMGGSVKVIDNATKSFSPISPSIRKNTALGFIVGLVLSIGIIFLINLFDTRIKSPDDIRNRYNYPVIGEIPNLLQE